MHLVRGLISGGGKIAGKPWFCLRLCYLSYYFSWGSELTLVLPY